LNGRVTNAALLVLGLQNDFLATGPLVVPGAMDLLPLINQLVGRFRIVAATQDWHPAGHRLFAANHAGCSPGATAVVRKQTQVLHATHCVQNTRGAEITPALSFNRVTRVIKTGTDPDLDTHSAFFDQERLRATGLNDYLREKGVKEVFLCGVALEDLVRHTALDAAGLGLRARVIIEACAARQPSEATQEQFESEMSEGGVKLVSASALLTGRVSALSRKPAG
jgi:nicotinamidase/pyrazinamidase